MQNAVKIEENGAAESFNITPHDENSWTWGYLDNH